MAQPIFLSYSKLCIEQHAICQCRKVLDSVRHPSLPIPVNPAQFTCTPVLVLHVIPSLLASTAAVTVVPLLPPQPTSMTPSLGTFLSVRNVKWVVEGLT